LYPKDRNHSGNAIKKQHDNITCSRLGRGFITTPARNMELKPSIVGSILSSVKTINKPNEKKHSNSSANAIFALKKVEAPSGLPRSLNAFSVQLNNGLIFIEKIILIKNTKKYLNGTKSYKFK
jgi:hypothetical protein